MIPADDLCFILEFWDLEIPVAINRSIIENTSKFLDYEQYLVDFFWGSGESKVTSLVDRELLLKSYKTTFRSTK